MIGAIRRAMRESRWSGFAAATAGIAALEFALILPIMLILYLGGFETSEAFLINRKVTHATSALGDLVAQSEELDDADIANIFEAVAAIMNPYPSGAVQMIVSGVYVDEDGTATVVWSDARNTTAHPADAEIDIPIDVVQIDTFIIVAEVSYVYTPQFGHTLVGDITLTDAFYLRPRLQNVVERT